MTKKFPMTKFKMAPAFSGVWSFGFGHSLVIQISEFVIHFVCFLVNPNNRQPHRNFRLPPVFQTVY
jgi:hypothetical protein